METVIISPGFQVRLPKRVRVALGLAPGQRLRVVLYGQRLELVPLRPAFECPALFGDTGSGGGEEGGDTAELTR
jgi:AbrB family looped-hinge helix DNA binding protein